MWTVTIDWCIRKFSTICYCCEDEEIRVDRRARVTQKNYVKRSSYMSTENATDSATELCSRRNSTQPTSSSLIKSARRSSLAVPTTTGIGRRASSKDRRRSILDSKEQPHFLYLHQDASASSDCGEDFGIGKLSFKIIHDGIRQQLVVDLQRASELPRVDITGACDAYVKVTVKPGEFKIEKTKIQYRTRNPKFNETKIFKGISEADLRGMTLNIKLLDWNRVQSNQMIGEVNCSLNLLLETDLIDNCKRMIQFHKCLTVSSSSENFLGSILMNLSLDMSQQQLKVTIVKARDLKAMDLNKLSDPFCIIKLYCGKEKLATRKTSIKYKTLNPVWNETFPFTVTQKNFSNTVSLRIKVFDKDPGSRDLIGELNFPSSEKSIETKHWISMINNQRETIGEWHSLKQSH